MGVTPLWGHGCKEDRDCIHTNIHAYIHQIKRGVFGDYKVIITLRDHGGKEYGGFDSTEYPVYFKIQQVRLSFLCVIACFLFMIMSCVCVRGGWFLVFISHTTLSASKFKVQQI